MNDVLTTNSCNVTTSINFNCSPPLICYFFPTLVNIQNTWYRWCPLTPLLISTYSYKCCLDTYPYYYYDYYYPYNLGPDGKVGLESYQGK